MLISSAAFKVTHFRMKKQKKWRNRKLYIITTEITMQSLDNSNLFKLTKRVTCLWHTDGQLDGWTNPNYRKASLLKKESKIVL